MLVYNAEKWLPKSINSILSQTYQNIELICVDDCSSDDSVQIILDYQKRDKRIVLLKNEINSGQGISRNKGINCATGELIGFIDNDDWYEKNAFEVLAKALTEKNVEVVFSNWYEARGDQYFPQKYYQKKLYNINKDAVSFFISPWGKLYRKDFLNKHHIRFGEQRIAEDRFFLCQIFAHTEKIYFLDDITYYWNLREDSVSHKKSSKKDPKFFIALDVADKCYRYIAANKPEILNLDSEILRFFDYCCRINIAVRFRFFREIHKIIKTWNIDVTSFTNNAALNLYKNFIHKQYLILALKIFAQKTGTKKFIKGICLFIPVKSWRQKIRKLYKKEKL